MALYVVVCFELFLVVVAVMAVGWPKRQVPLAMQQVWEQLMLDRMALLRVLQ